MAFFDRVVRGPWQRKPARQQVSFRPVRELAPPPPDHALVDIAIGPAGEIIALWVSRFTLPAATSFTTEASGVRFRDAQPSGWTPGHVSIDYQDGRTETITLALLPVAHGMVQPWPGGGVLVVGSRCWWEEGKGAEANAFVFDAAGQLIQSGVLGDGIAQVSVTPAGAVWAGYFDEGIFGNYGWGRSETGAPAPIGAPGLVRFTPQLEVDWEFPYEEAPPIYSCSMLNVAGETAWCSYYDSYPIVEVADQRPRVWQTSREAGGIGLVVTDTGAGILEREDGHIITMYSLDRGQAQASQELELVVPGQPDALSGATLLSRGSAVHALIDHQWLVADLARDVTS